MPAPGFRSGSSLDLLTRETLTGPQGAVPGPKLSLLLVDFGVNVRFHDAHYDLTHLLPGSAKTDRRGYAIGTIEYPPEPNADGTSGDPEKSKGVIVYVKSTLTLAARLFRDIGDARKTGATPLEPALDNVASLLGF